MSKNAVICPYCGATVARAKLCRACGKLLDRAPATFAWDRRAGELAARMRLPAETERRDRSLVAGDEERIVLLDEDDIVATLGPGAHELSPYAGRAALVAAFVSAGENPVAFVVPGLFAADNRDVVAQGELVVLIVDPVLFVTGFMRGLPVATVQDLADEFADELLDALDDPVREVRHDDLRRRGESHRAYEDAVAERLHADLARIGVTIDRIRSLEFIEPGVLEVRREHAGARAARVGWHEIEERARVRERLMATENLDRLAAAKDRAEIERIRREIDADRTLDDVEWKELSSMARGNRADRQRARLHALRMLEELRSHELTLRRLKQEIEAAEIRRRVGNWQKSRRGGLARDIDTDARPPDTRKDAPREDESVRRMSELDIEKILVEGERDLTPEQVLAIRNAETPEDAEQLLAQFHDENAQRLTDNQRYYPGWTRRAGLSDDEQPATEDIRQYAADPDFPPEGVVVRSCPACGVDNPVDARHCIVCGFMLP